ncbi:SAM-dependent methyltransferase [Actinomadura sp. DC4]|uniref:SAM-dependent methyltransferase n=1 Tax=Actinomadura sp. DC4 TaxID=3055069 RepID=UPI0025B03F72|nr:SAM-dependent methyltransferase [Actinomadura sp. DC4]MDN3354631.1 SAM-dependent methyltransferase [Actinomadura sp. DC4]
MTLSGVGATSLGVARARARESLRPDRLFDDPYAAAFAVAGEHRAVTPARARLAFHVIIRTRFYDDYLLASGCRQVVLLAAGLDTRTYRLPWAPGVQVYELDLPSVLSYKAGVLAGVDAVPRCSLTTLPVDLRTDWPSALVGAGFSPAVPTAWLIEGLLVYLTAVEASLLLTRVGSLSAPGSRVSFERNNAASAIAAGDRAGIESYAELWKGGLGEDPVAWLSSHGWSPETHALVDVAASYGRTVLDESFSGFLTATYDG